MRYVIPGLSAATALTLLACSPPAEKAAPGAPDASAPAGQQVQVQAPAGEYRLDPNHASLSFKINHMGLSNYTARFARFDATLKLDPANPSASSVNVTIDPASITTDRPSPAEYKALPNHGDRPYRGWNDDLARAPEYFDAGQYPEITFRSTRVETTGPSTARITGDLTLHGQTHPVTLDATLVGSLADRFGQGPAIGFSATGNLSRSQFGMTHLVAPHGQPTIVGDDVTVQFDGEFVSATPPAAEQAK